jgi:sortase A
MAMAGRSPFLREWAAACSIVLFTAALFFTTKAAWVPVKAELGQWLLERAWRERLAGDASPRPWPWADSSPVGVLEIPRLGLRQLVLAGDSGRNLAWGPAAIGDLSLPDRVISGHRDTHFTALRDLRPGDRLSLSTAEGKQEYRVAWLDIVDSRRQELVLEPGRQRLTLVTCWPFDAPDAGGPLRLVVTALPRESFPDLEAQASSQAGTGKSLARRNSGFQSLDW